MTNKKFSFGSDPEFFLTKDGKYCSAIGVVPGNKDKRHRIGENTFYYDNVLAECTIQPADTKKKAIDNVGKCLKAYAKLVAPYKLVPIAAHVFDRSEFTHDDAFKVGCKRETCAYSLTEPEPPEEIFLTTGLRSAGGHIHLGAPIAQDGYGCLSIIRMMDLFLGVPSIFINHDKSSKTRKQVYGQAGRYRKPEHGAEYRSLSNFWLQSPELVGLVFDISKFTVDFVAKEKHKDFWHIDEERLDDDAAWEDDDFDPADCHICTGYDVGAMRKVIEKIDKKKGQDLLTLAIDLLPDKISSPLQRAMENPPSDMYEEWKL